MIIISGYQKHLRLKKLPPLNFCVGGESRSQDSVIQRFEFTIELSWKTLRKYLENEGIVDINSPKQTVRSGFENGILENGKIWIEMLNDRNITSHIYDQEIADKIYGNITEKYIDEIKILCEKLEKKEIE